MIIQLGNLQFSTDMGYETLDRVYAWQWAEVPIVGDYPILQFAYKEAPTITFEGTWYNYVAIKDEVQKLVNMGNESEPLPLTSDQGVFYGFWVIKSLSRQEEFFRPKQHSAIKNAWTMTIAFYGNTKTRGI